MKALKIHPNPFVTAGFLVACCMLLAFLYGFPMLTSQADEGEDEDASGQSLECDYNPQPRACDVRYCTPAPTPTPRPPGCHYDDIEDRLYCPTPTPPPTTPPPIDCEENPSHRSCRTPTPTTQPPIDCNRNPSLPACTTPTPIPPPHRL